MTGMNYRQYGLMIYGKRKMIRIKHYLN